MSRIPSFNRKVRVLADWTLAFVLRREVISLGQLHTPREEFTHVTPPLSDDRTAEPVGAGSR
jgi:NADH dehydrogenase